jgi:hypothetical protein
MCAAPEATMMGPKRAGAAGRSLLAEAWAVGRVDRHDDDRSGRATGSRRTEQMKARMRTGMTRRAAVSAAAIGGAAIVGAGLGTRTNRALAAARQRSVTSTGGIAGGGLLEGPDASVHFSLFGTRVPLGEGDAEEMIFSGRVILVDPLQGWRMESVEVTSYGPIEGDDENARELRGTMAVTMGEATAEYPFVLRALDGGGPTEGEDTLTLAVGAAAEDAEGGATDVFSYELNGTVSAGDITLVEVALAEE